MFARAPDDIGASTVAKLLRKGAEDLADAGLEDDERETILKPLRKMVFNTAKRNIIDYSLVLLQRRPEILSYVSAKFAWILVDEFQDTTDLQVEILSLIAAANRTRFLLVGDPYQSIFRFAGSRPDLAEEFAARISARTDITCMATSDALPRLLQRNK